MMLLLAIVLHSGRPACIRLAMHDTVPDSSSAGQNFCCQSQISLDQPLRKSYPLHVTWVDHSLYSSNAFDLLHLTLKKARHISALKFKMQSVSSRMRSCLMEGVKETSMGNIFIMFIVELRKARKVCFRR
jgi:hypothetical protein